jgi:type IV pilus assembly protein PilA
VGIAIPAFLGARKRAQDTASKSNLRNALSTAQTVFTDTQAFPITPGTGATGMISVLTNEEPSLTFLDGSATGVGHTSGAAKEISVNSMVSAPNLAASGTNLDEIILASKSGSGKCFFLRHINTAAAAGLSGSYMAETTSGGCSAKDAPADASTTPPWTAL